MTDTYSHEERVAMYEAAQRYGGSFDKALLKAYIYADIGNRARIERAFPEVLSRYYDMTIKTE